MDDPGESIHQMVSIFLAFEVADMKIKSHLMYKKKRV
jgi:hypothetical protein